MLLDSFTRLNPWFFSRICIYLVFELQIVTFTCRFWCFTLFPSNLYGTICIPIELWISVDHHRLACVIEGVLECNTHDNPCSGESISSSVDVSHIDRPAYSLPCTDNHKVPMVLHIWNSARRHYLFHHYLHAWITLGCSRRNGHQDWVMLGGQFFFLGPRPSDVVDTVDMYRKTTPHLFR